MITGKELMGINELCSTYNRVIDTSHQDYAQQRILILNFMMAAPKLPPQISAAVLEHLQPIHARMYGLTEVYAQQRR